jgi:uncharacterized protein (DUF305 family)
MTAYRRSTVRFLLIGTAGLFLAAGGVAAQQAPIVQPGAPGQPSRPLTPAEAAQIAETRFSPDDVRFMQHMIPHHAQALEMAALVKGRTSRKDLREVAGRIDASQSDEMRFMRTWLRERRQPEAAPMMAGAGHEHHAVAEHTRMGMATPEQMAALRAAKGPEFDRQFLQRMITHHEGAVTMAKELLDKPGSAHDPVLAAWVDEVINEQGAEIERMERLLVGLVDDPRSGLKAGFRDAGQAPRNMVLLASLPKPTGFFDPSNPGGLPLPVPPKEGERGKGQPAKPGDVEVSERGAFLDFANTDMAFSGNLLAAGNYHGFNLYRLQPGTAAPQLLSSVVCPGGQGDMSIVGNLLIMSVEQRRGRVDCGRQGVAEDVSAERFRGLRIFNIADPTRPVQVGQVQTCRGSHTHSVVSGPGRDGKIIVYVSGTSSVRKEEELKGCVGDVPGDRRTALFRIDVIEIPVADPARSRIVDSPGVFADERTGTLAGLWRGGDHGDGTQTTSRTDQCHDITVFPSAKLAAGACSGNGIIFSIADPRRPKRIDAVVDPTFAYWHSATFNNDGTKVLFTDEWGGGARPRCRTQDPRNWGADAIYDISGGKLKFRSHYKLPAIQTEQENCVAHNGSIVPVPGRDIFLQAWYQGGISVMDFTDSANPREIASFDRGPLDPKHLTLAGYWSAYWYGGRVYGTEIARGLDVLALQPSADLSANEIAAAALAQHADGRFNPQQQQPVRWPDHPVVALAYLDQLERGGAVSAGAAAPLRQTLTAASAPLQAGAKDRSLADRLGAAASALALSRENEGSRQRLASLRRVAQAVAARLN